MGAPGIYWAGACVQEPPRPTLRARQAEKSCHQISGLPCIPSKPGDSKDRWSGGYPIVGSTTALNVEEAAETGSLLTYPVLLHTPQPRGAIFYRCIVYLCALNYLDVLKWCLVGRQGVPQSLGVLGGECCRRVDVPPPQATSPSPGWPRHTSGANPHTWGLQTSAAG